VAPAGVEGGKGVFSVEWALVSGAAPAGVEGGKGAFSVEWALVSGASRCRGG
jgi:hypothetical protein